MLADGPDRDLELGRAKLLLSPPPRGLHVRSELLKRLDLWGRGDFEALLVRAEAQAEERASNWRGRQSAQAGRGKRARRLAREQAFRKGVTTLTGSVAALTPADEARWASELLPASARPGGGCARPVGEQALPPTLPGDATPEVECPLTALDPPGTQELGGTQTP